MDRDATVAKACRLIEEAADHGANVIGFPEGFIPGFPDWYNWFMPRSPESLRCHKALFKNAVEIDSPAVQALIKTASKTHTQVAVGINERRPGSMGSLFNTLLFIGPNGINGVHRKLVPTLMERLVHVGGDGESLRTYPTEFGNLGGLICGENTNSLARFALLAQDEHIHVASWPAFVFSNQNNFESIDIRSRYHAFEGKVFVINACGILDDDCLDTMGLNEAQRATLSCRGGHSGIVGPNGNYVVGPVDDTAQIVYADADLEKIIEGKYAHDLTGHGNRFDIFTLNMKVAARRAFRREDLPNDPVSAATKPSEGETPA